mmetsp:Transcript_77488/g.237169  ORF Transcript_77488/g.237169 Transcript_77488/m.237169 type:complete len:266 (+) Transcript_77488:451-1248(+)
MVRPALEPASQDPLRLDALPDPGPQDRGRDARQAHVRHAAGPRQGAVHGDDGRADLHRHRGKRGRAVRVHLGAPRRGGHRGGHRQGAHGGVVLGGRAAERPAGVLAERRVRPMLGRVERHLHTRVFHVGVHQCQALRLAQGRRQMPRLLQPVPADQAVQGSRVHGPVGRSLRPGGKGPVPAAEGADVVDGPGHAGPGVVAGRSFEDAHQNRAGAEAVHVRAVRPGHSDAARQYHHALARKLGGVGLQVQVGLDDVLFAQGWPADA